MTSDCEKFSPSELAVVISHYELGVIHSAKEYPRGSRRAPKLLLQTARGNFLLKRRAPGKDDPYRVAFTHALLAHLHRRRIPVPELVGTRDDNNSLLQLNQYVYELFEYVDGEGFDGSLERTTRAGQTLASYHRAVEDFRSEWTLPSGSFHNAAGVLTGLNSIPSSTGGHDSVVGHEAELLATTQRLYELYENAAGAVGRGGFAQWPTAISHGDWHPGNLLFQKDRVAAVLDLDAARLQPSVLDLANGMLQFSILRGRGEPDTWPDYFDETRMRRFLLGYQAHRQVPVEQRMLIPELMIESLIAESVLPIAATGSFGWLPGFGILKMVHRKANWLLANLERVRTWAVE